MQIRKEGINFDKSSGKFTFDWKTDGADTIVPLALQSYNRYIATKQGVKLYYAYKFSKDVDKAQKDPLRTALKYLESDKIDVQQVELMITKAVTAFNTLKPLTDYDLIVFPKSSSNLLTLLEDHFKQKVDTAEVVSDVFVKTTLDSLQFDAAKLSKLPQDIRDKMITRVQAVVAKEGWKLRDIDVRHREYLVNFLKFNSELERKVFNLIQGGKVLLVDDILTKGGTVANMSNLLTQAGATEVTGFIFLGNN